MQYHVYKPGLPLSQYVKLMWSVRSTGARPSLRRVFPDGTMTLVIHLNRPSATYFVDDQTHTIDVPLLAGPYTRYFHIDPSQSTAVIGIVLRPGAARIFFPVPAHELHNVDISLSQFSPADADRLLNDVCSVSGEQAQFLAVERYLNRKLTNALRIPPAIPYAVEQLSRQGARSIQKIQSDVGLSHTRFIQLFREHVGLAPKLFYRVRRFRGLIDRIENRLPVNWAQLAVDCGYFDQ